MSHALYSSLCAYLRTLSAEGAIPQAACDNAERLVLGLDTAHHPGFGFPTAGPTLDGKVRLAYDDGVYAVDYEIDATARVIVRSFNRATGTTQTMACALEELA